MKKKVEIYILAGFLGSGKTTLLKNLLEEEKEAGRKVAVLMNELGRVSIDSDVIPSDTPLKELLDGCICCTIQGQLENQIHTLIHENELEAIYIEATGAAHPIEVLDACMSPLFANDVVVKNIISVVDAKRWMDRKSMSIRLQRLIHEQVRHADILLINKVDQLNDAEQASVIFEIQSINPMAKSLFTQFAKVNIKDLQNVASIKREKHEQTHVHEQLHLKTFVYEFKKPISRSKFENWLRAMPDSLYRIKGYLKFTDSTSLVSFQYSYGMPFYMPEMLNLPMNLVFIGEELDHEQMKKELFRLEENS